VAWTSKDGYIGWIMPLAVVVSVNVEAFWRIKTIKK